MVSTSDFLRRCSYASTSWICEQFSNKKSRHIWPRLNPTKEVRLKEALSWGLSVATVMCCRKVRKGRHVKDDEDVARRNRTSSSDYAVVGREKRTAAHRKSYLILNFLALFFQNETCYHNSIKCMRRPYLYSTDSSKMHIPRWR